MQSPAHDQEPEENLMQTSVRTSTHNFLLSTTLSYKLVTSEAVTSDSCLPTQQEHCSASGLTSLLYSQERCPW